MVWCCVCVCVIFIECVWLNMGCNMYCIIYIVLLNIYI